MWSSCLISHVTPIRLYENMGVPLSFQGASDLIPLFTLVLLGELAYI